MNGWNRRDRVLAGIGWPALATDSSKTPSSVRARTLTGAWSEPWVRALDTSYEAGEFIGLNNYPHVAAWLQRCMARTAVQRGLQVPERP